MILCLFSIEVVFGVELEGCIKKMLLVYFCS